ncbi:MAG: hypothetical protein WCK98_03050 [bacterium]
MVLKNYYDKFENQKNSNIILNFLKKSEAKTVLDICCGAFDELGTNYDEKGLIYQPLVAQTLGKNGFEVTGIDFRQNHTQEQIFYKHVTGIDILKGDWPEKMTTKFDSLIFLRSWDTPEILFYFQDKFPLLSLNELSIKIAHSLLPDFIKCLNLGGILITSEIFNFGLCDTNDEARVLKNQTLNIFETAGFKLLDVVNGLYFLKLISN